MPAPHPSVRSSVVVERPRLFDRLSSGLDAGLTLVSAPAGSGKTVLLRSWIDAAGLGERTAWVSVEPDERDGQRFWLSVVEALRAAGVHEGLDNLVPTPGLVATSVVDRIVAAAASLDAPVVLVLDDLHHLADPSAMAGLDDLLARRPPMLRVVLVTRHDPALNLHRRRLAGELAELRGRDLWFDTVDAAQLLAAAGVALPDAAVVSLVERTEGWAAGLRLAALSMARDPDPQRFLATFSGSDRAVADYLFAEVLARQPDAVRTMLVRTSILDRISGPLADAVAGAPGSERILLELEDEGAFVYAIDAQRTWFRYHALFADLLRLELRRTEPEAIPGLHRAAAAWLAERGDPVAAVRHAEAAQDWATAGDLLARHGFTMALDGSFARVRALLDAFPPDALAAPEIAALLAYGEVIRPSFDTAEEYLALAQRHASEVREGCRRTFDALIATTRLTMARWRGDARSVADDVRPLLEPADARDVRDVAVTNDLRAVAVMSLGIVELWAGAGDEAEQHLREAVELAGRIGRPYVEMGSRGHLTVAVGRRSLSDARREAEATLAMMERYGWESEPVAPMVFAAMAAIDAWRARFDDASAWLDRAERLLGPGAEPAKALFVRSTRALELVGRGRLADAAAVLGDARAIHEAMVSPDPIGVQARGIEVQALVRLGRLDEARAVLATATEAEQAHAETRNGVAAVRLAEGDPRAAMDALTPTLAGDAVVVRDTSVINALLLAALAHEALGEATRAEDDVERALDLAERDGVVLPFVIVPVAPLLERHPRHRTAHAALLGSVLDVLGGGALAPWRDGPPTLQEPLTESELRVLRYLPSNLSAPEIAAEVFLSTSTVKTHMRHIYEKLGVHRRTEAVQLARELGLLGPSGRAGR
jgi:LuxR family maltose regulon positive regulatory protein